MEVIYDLDTEAARTAEKLGPRRWPGPRPPGTDPRFVTMLRDLVVERAAAERGEQPARGRASASSARPGTTAATTAAHPLAPSCL